MVTEPDMIMMDVMLRTTVRSDVIECHFRDRGYKIIIPKRKRDGGRAPDFFV